MTMRATILLLAPHLFAAKPFGSEHMVDFANKALKAGQYNPVTTLEIDNGYRGGRTGEAVAEEMFDLTNNPDRDAERLVKYGRTDRSVSSGDIINVDGVLYLCLSFGWHRL